jgi:hypothetical protein
VNDERAEVVCEFGTLWSSVEVRETYRRRTSQMAALDRKGLYGLAAHSIGSTR